MIRTALTALATAAICFGVTATTGFASHAKSPHSGGGHSHNVSVGDEIRIPSVDVYCGVLRADPRGIEAGPLLTCARYSTLGKDSRGMGASKRDFWLTDESGSTRIDRVPRTP
jgi:hypothetical protein